MGQSRIDIESNSKRAKIERASDHEYLSTGAEPEYHWPTWQLAQGLA